MPIDLARLPVYAHMCTRLKISEHPTAAYDTVGYVGGKTCPFCGMNLLEDEVRSRVAWVERQLPPEAYDPRSVPDRLLEDLGLVQTAVIFSDPYKRMGETD